MRFLNLHESLLYLKTLIIIFKTVHNFIQSKHRGFKPVGLFLIYQGHAIHILYMGQIIIKRLLRYS